jgi:Protein of unknown function (DUF2961)
MLMKFRLGLVLCLAGLLCGCACSTHGGGTMPVTSPLMGVADAHPGQAMHTGSWDRTGGNADFLAVAPGQTVTLLDHRGAGIIRRFWVTIAPRAEMHVHSQAILRMYWDDEKEPSVECPVGAFFGVGFGQQKDYISLPLNEISGGYNCYWPMPFHKHAYWTLENRSNVKIDAFYYNVDYTALKCLPAGMKQFHASYRRENPTQAGQNYTILDAEGDGQYVGTALFMQAIKPHDIGFLEGDEMIYIDGRKEPTPAGWHHSMPVPQINGTGTEDYFSSGWYFDHGVYSAPYHGVVIKNVAVAQVSAYRWNIEDAIPFHKKILVTIEHGTNNDHVADYSSVAYFYQSGPHKPYPPLPANAEDLLPTMQSMSGGIEGEDLVPHATASAGNVSVQGMGGFSGTWSGGAQLFWNGGNPGAELNLQVPAKRRGPYQLSGIFTTAPDYGTIQVYQNGVGIGGPIDLFSPQVQPTPITLLGPIQLQRGDNPITIRIVGKDPQSTNYFVGIDALKLEQIK